MVSAGETSYLFLYTNKKNMRPLFRYPGGKRRLIKNCYPKLPLGSINYFEPFFGSGAMLCALVNSGAAIKQAHINDLDTNLVDIYKYIQSHDVSQIKLDTERYGLTQVPTKEYFLSKLKVYNSGTQRHPIVFLYLMRNSFSGMFRYAKTNPEQILMGLGHALKKQWCYKELQQWHEVLQKTTISNTSYEKVSLGFTPSFTFIDPPYFDSKFNYQLGRDNEGGANEFSQSVIDYYSQQHNGVVWIANKKSSNINPRGFKAIEVNNYYNLGRRKSETVQEVLFTHNLV